MCERSEHHPVLGTNKKVLHEVRDFLFGGVQSLLCKAEK
jgi:hypothetical protein